MDAVKNFIKSVSNKHTFNPKYDNVIIVSTPRSGSTWLMELIWTQPGFKTINEPLNVRVNKISKEIGVKDFSELYDLQNEQKVFKVFWENSEWGN